MWSYFCISFSLKLKGNELFFKTLGDPVRNAKSQTVRHRLPHPHTPLFLFLERYVLTELKMDEVFYYSNKSISHIRYGYHKAFELILLRIKFL